MKENYAQMSKDYVQMRIDHDESLDTMWVILGGLLVFFMHAGFSLLESGTVRFKNAQNILVKNLIVVTTGFLCWYAVGYALAFGVETEPSRFAGSRSFFMDGLWEDKTVFKTFFFQGTFCATSGTIVSGAMAERTKLKGFFFFTVTMTSVIYPIVAYWCWSGAGFLNYTNSDGKQVTSWDGPAFQDFAGAGVVHMIGGFAALCGAVVVGPRNGRWDEWVLDDFAPHNVPFLCPRHLLPLDWLVRLQPGQHWLDAHRRHGGGCGPGHYQYHVGSVCFWSGGVRPPRPRARAQAHGRPGFLQRYLGGFGGGHRHLLLRAAMGGPGHRSCSGPSLRGLVDAHGQP